MTKENVDFILNVLRRGTTIWPGRRECLERFRRKRFVRRTKDGNPVYKLEWQCQACLDWFRDVKQLEVDHIEEVGPFKGDFDEWIRRLYCDQSNLEPLCQVCHMKKTARFNSARSRYQRRK